MSNFDQNDEEEFLFELALCVGNVPRTGKNVVY